jgi:hypothetical protein
MTSETTHICDQCANTIDQKSARVSATINVFGADGISKTNEYDFHSFAHLIAWAQAQPEPE